uniref:Pentacotripeptide-repeat region of PRORP domain-containing protein n=1 Tax=Salix viminalis TaxID=40686 RepID=A0A6N2NM92_SALVM
MKELVIISAADLVEDQRLLRGLLLLATRYCPPVTVGRIDEAFRFLHNLIEDGHKPFPSLYAPIIKGMFRRGQFDDAFCFFSEMKVKGHPPNRPVYTMMITMCGRGGKHVEAANYLVEMTEIGLVPISRCFDMVTDGLKNCGKHDLAKRIEQLEVSLRGV